MNKKFIIVAILFLFNLSCDFRNQQSDSNEYIDNCRWLRHDNDLFAKLFENDYAQSISDSFTLSLYVNYYKTMLKNPYVGKDSINVLELDIVPKILVNSRGDSDVFDIAYAFTDTTCTHYFDSALKSKEPIIYGFRFSITERRIICFLTSNLTWVEDSSFMKIQAKIQQPEFIRFVKDSADILNSRFINLFYD